MSIIMLSVSYLSSSSMFIGILNSKLIAFWLKHKGKMQGNNYQIDKEPLLKIPLPIFENVDTEKVSQIISLVDEIINEKRQGNDTLSLEKQIDILVYEIYDLSDDDIKVVEANI